MGHGSHDGSDMITVPKGLPVTFFTDEGSPLLMVNLLELAKRDNPRTPMHTLNPGDPVPNYQYTPFKPHELRAVTQFNQLVPPQLIVGSAAVPNTLRLCADKARCPKDGPHTCDGVFGRATKGQWTKVLVLSCRILEGHTQQPTVALMTPAGKRDTSVFDALLAWVKGFVARGSAGQDAAWAAVPESEKIRLIASEDEVREWVDCLDVRTKIAAADRPKAAALVAAAPTSVKLRLMRDYPQHRDLVKVGITLTATEQQAIAAFQREALAKQIDKWLGLTPDQQVRWLAEPPVASWAVGFNVLELFQFGLVGDELMAVLRRLDPVARGVALAEEELRDYLAANSLHI
ncbi:putative adhesin [Alloactinosynnema sp. L-07]|uniref:putative adhesin n=1 Tax=Alloactinosynnema sp. L-07 TaxID=1653480 RepID=UPI0035101ECA